MERGYVLAGDFIRNRREALGLSQDDLVKALTGRNVNASVSAVSRIETGQSKRLTDEDFLMAISAILGVSESEILELTGHLRDLPITPRLQRLIKVASTLDDERLETAEALLKVLAEQQLKTRVG